MSEFSKINDERINAENILVEIKIEDYLNIVRDIVHKNIYQRRKVKGSKTVYALLKNDLELGCTFPPIALSISTDITDLETAEEIKRFIETNKDKLIILDGLQRTFTMLSLQDELNKKGNETGLKKLNEHKIRLEIFAGIDKLGILYRMLTLNTGQTPMSLRHQIEIIYLDYLDQDLEGIKLIREVEGASLTFDSYIFRDAIEGFQSYLEIDELPIDRYDLLGIIKGLEALRKGHEEKDLFKDFIRTYHNFFIKINSLGEGWRFDDTEIDIPNSVLTLGKTVDKIFKKPQVISGFGAAIGKLILEFCLLDSFEDVRGKVAELRFDEKDKALNNLIKNLIYIGERSKKIGNAQRMYFAYFFRELFNKESDSHLVIDKAIQNGFKKFVSQTF